MKKIAVIILAIGLVIIFINNSSDILGAGTRVNQTISIPVAAITEFSISGAPPTLKINSAIPGFEPGQAITANATYNITTNESNKKITGIINSAMPPGAVLTVNLAAPPGAASLGDVALSTVAADLVTGISKVAVSGKQITYKLSSTVAAGIIASTSRVVTFTVTN
ncbi:MAG: hypothetical protein K6U80_09995 [Firmicutes bacterium]|nr:hypothetical protein [Bacillota bacterium]